VTVVKRIGVDREVLSRAVVARVEGYASGIGLRVEEKKGGRVEQSRRRRMESHRPVSKLI
jgi:hypothetical protein